MNNDNKDFPIFNREQRPKQDVLIIDDDYYFLRMVREILETKGYSVDIATNGKEGLKLMERINYKVIGTDIIMPDGDGFEVILYAKAQGIVDRMIAWSAGGRAPAEDYLFTARHFGVTDTFSTPLDTTAFKDAIERKIKSQK